MILEAVNHAYPETISRLGLVAFEGSQPYGGVHVTPFEGKTLPDESEIDTLVEAYEASIKTARLKAHLAKIRWEKETGGMPVDNSVIATDDRSKTLINGAWAKATSNADFTTQFKTLSGWREFTASEIIQIAEISGSFVSICFGAEQSVDSNIADYDTEAEVTEAFNTVFNTLFNAFLEQP